MAGCPTHTWLWCSYLSLAVVLTGSYMELVWSSALDWSLLRSVFLCVWCFHAGLQDVALFWCNAHQVSLWYLYNTHQSSSPGCGAGTFLFSCSSQWGLYPLVICGLAHLNVMWLSIICGSWSHGQYCCEVQRAEVLGLCSVYVVTPGTELATISLQEILKPPSYSCGPHWKMTDRAGAIAQQ